MSPQLPAGPFGLQEALIAYGDPVAVRQRRSAELYAGREAVERFADFRFTLPDEEDSHGVRDADPEARLLQSRKRLVEPLLEQVLAERIFLRGVPAELAPGSPNELIPNAWAFELELTIGASTARRLTDRWLAVIATTTRPRADELATSRNLVEASETATVERLSDGVYALQEARLRLSAPELAQQFQNADFELRQLREFVAGRRPPGFSGIVLGLDPAGRDLADHRLVNHRKQAASALQADFLARILDGRISLTGLQTQPTLANARALLSPDWAPHMVFDWQRNAIRIFEAVFIDVRGQARRIMPPKVVAVTRTIASRQVRGRPRFPFDLLVGIASDPTWQRATYNKNEADALLAAFQMRHPERAVPGYRTVLSHVAKIYAAVPKRAATQKAVKSRWRLLRFYCCRDCHWRVASLGYGQVTSSG